MKGGYQILNLTGATAGSPVEVKGIYKAAAGNNGKPVMILTNDGQRVYAEIAEDDGDFITCYISAEGKTVNITIKSDDSVTTVVSDPGASITGLEQAVNDLNDNKAAKSDITDLVCTGTKNTTGSTIPAAKYFYLNDVLCRAKTAINNDADFTLNTNYEEVTVDDELTALNNNKADKNPVADVEFEVPANTTWTQLLALFRANLDFTKITPRTYAYFADAVYHVTQYTSSYVGFFRGASSSAPKAFTLYWGTDSDSSAFDRSIVDTTNVLSNAVSGEPFTVYVYY